MMKYLYLLPLIYVIFSCRIMEKELWLEHYNEGTQGSNNCVFLLRKGCLTLESLTDTPVIMYSEIFIIIEMVLQCSFVILNVQV